MKTKQYYYCYILLVLLILSIFLMFPPCKLVKIIVSRYNKVFGFSANTQMNSVKRSNERQ